MNNRHTLYLLLGLAAVAGAGRWYTGYLHGKYQAELSSHKQQYRYIYENADELQQRRSKISVAETEERYNSHFQEKAGKGARMGRIDIVPRQQELNNYLDKRFEIKFLDHDSAFLRQQVAHFLFNSEVEMPRMRTVELKIAPAPREANARRGVPPGEDREDLWKVSSLVFIQRTPTAKKKT